MNLATLKKLERAAWNLMRAVEKAAKTDFRAKQLREQYSNLWKERYDEFKAAANAAAAKRDKGNVLFTVFLPESNAVVEKIRTANRNITIHHWKGGWPVTTHYETHGKPSVEILSALEKKWSMPEKTFEAWMRAKAA